MVDGFFTLISNSGVGLLFKLGFSTLLFLYTIFTIFVIAQVASLNKLVFIRPANTSQALFILAIVQFIISISLFLLSLVIL